METYRRYNENLEVSNLGNVKKNGKVVKLKTDGTGYYYVCCHSKQIRVHTMVGECFPEICGEKMLFGNYHHLNHIKTDNRAENIKCISDSEHKSLHQIEDGVSVAVKAYDKKGNYVGRWDSMLQAAIETGQKDHRHISSLVFGKEENRFTAGKLFWFKEETPESEVEEYIRFAMNQPCVKREAKERRKKKREEIKKNRALVQVDEFGSIVRYWVSASEVADFYGIRTATIYSNLNGKTALVKKILPRSKFYYKKNFNKIA